MLGLIAPASLVKSLKASQIQVFLYDLCNIAKDRAAEARTLSTTDELYISASYFSPEEATLIKATMVSPPTIHDIHEFKALELYNDDDLDAEGDEATQDPQSAPRLLTIEEAIKSCLQNFFEKRRASGDARPCGPHDMGPIYTAVFGVTKEELKNEKFLSRLRRAGLEQPKKVDKEGSGEGKQIKKGKKKG